MRWQFPTVCCIGLAACAGPAQRAAVPERAVLAQALTAAPGDPGRGRDVVLSREANCLLCHAVPGEPGRAMGNIGPPLAGVGARLGPAELRARIIDSLALNPDSVMPSYYRTDGFTRVAGPLKGKPILTAHQVEDTIAYLLTLR